jgi:hypothetical protein
MDSGEDAIKLATYDLWLLSGLISDLVCYFMIRAGVREIHE